MGKIEIKGPIISDCDQFIYDYFGIPATSPGVVNKALASAKDGEEMEIIINSDGGLVFSGSEIYTALRSYKGKTVVKIVGRAASAASVIAMGATEVIMSPTAQMMIHCASSWGGGNKNDFEHLRDVLSSVDESIATAYQIKTKIPTSNLLDMMSKETWLNAAKAKELGFADGIMFEDEVKAMNALPDAAGMLPQAVIDKMRGELSAELKGLETTNDTTLVKAKLKLAIAI